MMKTIILKNSCIETVKMNTEFIHWECPECGEAHRTIEWSIKNQELWCCICKEAIRYSWEKLTKKAEYEKI